MTDVTETPVLSWPPEVQAILEEDITLENGERAPIVTEDKTAASLRFYCNICKATVNTVSNLHEHVRGNRHFRALSQKDCFPLSKYRRVRSTGDANSAADAKTELVELAPGEPVPPGFEDEVHRLPQISSKLQLMQTPLLGLEFLAEVTPADAEAEPRYLCMLCDKKGDKRTVLAHLISFNHRIRYLARFFPRAMAAFEAIPKLKEYRRGTGEILSRVVKAIEAKNGRLNPVIIEDEDFDLKKATLFQSMMQSFHILEKPEDAFEKLVNLDEIKKLSTDAAGSLMIDEEVLEAKRLSATVKTSFKHRTADEISALAEKKEVKKTEDKEVEFTKIVERESNKTAVRREGTVQKRYYGAKRGASGSVSPISSDSRSRSRSPKRSRSRSRYRSPGRRAPYRRTWSRSRSRSRSRGRYQRRYSPQRRSPRRSPVRRSPIRRATAWRGRQTAYVSNRPVLSFKVKATPSLATKELEAEAAKKEKIKQYKLYAKALSDEMVQKMKTYEKTPEKHPQYSEEWKKFWNKRYKELTAEGKDAAKYDFKPEWIKFWTVRIKELNDEEVKTRLKSFKTEIGLLEDLSDSNDDDDDEVMEITVKKGTSEKSEEVEVTIIHVLRLLAALEDQLGSLGPKVNNLLSQALALDKVRKGNAERLLDNSENVVLFETAKEKLKGQLFAGVVERHHTKGTKKAISAVAELLTIREKIEQEAVAAVRGMCAEPLVVPGVGAVDKLAIAQQIATALVAQGRTDLSEAELEQLINAVVGMAQVNQTTTAKPAPEPTPTKDDSSTLQELLSFVVQTQSDSAKKQSSSLALLQSYGDSTSTAEAQLSDNDLKTLLQNFDNLSKDEQKFLAGYLKLGDVKGTDNKKNSNDLAKSDVTDSTGRLSPFSSRSGGANPSSVAQTNFEDDEDEYSYEDVFKAAKKNVRREAAAKRAVAAEEDAVELAKKQARKGVVEQMIRDQEKKTIFAKVVPAPAVTKPSVLIDPNDLFPTMPDTSKSPPKPPPAEKPVQHEEMQATDPAPVTEAPPAENTWDGYNYASDPSTYNYQQGGSYAYGVGEEGQPYACQEYGYGYEQQAQPTDPYSANGYNYPPPPQGYDPNYPPSQYHSYY